MTKDEEVMADVRKRCQTLVDKWSKFIMDKYANKERSNRTPQKARRERADEREDIDPDGEEYRYARIPRPMSFDITVRPKSDYRTSDARKSGKGDEPSRFKKLNNVLSSGRAGGRAPPKVLQG